MTNILNGTLLNCELSTIPLPDKFVDSTQPSKPEATPKTTHVQTNIASEDLFGVQIIQITHLRLESAKIKTMPDTTSPFLDTFVMKTCPISSRFDVVAHMLHMLNLFKNNKTIEIGDSHL